MAEYSVINNEEARRFECHVDGYVALIDYRNRPGKIVYTHTEVPPQLEGRGIGSAMARAALDYARQSGIKVVPLCPFVKSYIERHQEYADLVA